MTSIQAVGSRNAANGVSQRRAAWRSGAARWLRWFERPCTAIRFGVVALAIFILPGPVAAAGTTLPGVTELRMPPEAVTDSELTRLLGTALASADVIAIGETVHGSAGMLRVQDRLIRHLVTKHGVRLVVWENPTLRSLELADWVRSCTKRRTPPPLAVLYMPTGADRPLWEWICEFNARRPDDPIVFRGMDVWDRPWEHYRRIRALVALIGIEPAHAQRIDAVCPAASIESWDEMQKVFAELAANGSFLPETQFPTCRSLLTTLLEQAQRMGATATQPDIRDAAFELALSASTLAGWLGFYHHQWSHDVLGWNERDRAQGRNLLLLMAKHRAARAILAAHTSHVSHNRSPADWWGYGDLKSGVHFFTALSGKKVFTIALTAYSASGTQGEWSYPTARNSMDKTLHDAGHVFSFFTSRAGFFDAHPKWWMQNGNYPGRYESGVEIVPRDHFDAYFFLDDSHLDRALPQRPMWEP